MTFTVRVYEPGESPVDGKASTTTASTERAHKPSTDSEGPTSSAAKSTKSKRKQVPMIAVVGSRQSKRLKASKNPFKEITVRNLSRQDTVMDLKKKVTSPKHQVLILSHVFTHR